MRWPAAPGLVVAALLAFFCPPAPAATVPAGFADSLVTTATQPTALTFLPDRRLLVTSKAGQLWLHSGSSQPALVVDLSARTCSQRERGLLGVAVAPDFATSRHVYLYYTFNKHNTCSLLAPPNGPVNRLSRFTLGTDNRINPSTEVVLLDNITSFEGIHNAGYLAFGNDGYLYVSVGDGFNGANARDRSVVNGKILRLTPSGGIPADNPYRGTNSTRCNMTSRTTPGTFCQEIYAFGLRNPFRLGFDQSSSRFFINDVGLASWEEINEGKKGADYGWDVREGHCAYNSTTDCGPPPAGMTNPIYDYGRDTGCGAITGGAFVPGGVWPAAYEGRYLFADYNCGQIKSLRSTALGWAAEPFGSALGPVTDLRFGPSGSTQALYYVTWTGPTTGEVRRIAYTGNRTPNAVARATPTEGGVPLGVLFDGSASGDPDGEAISYRWNFGDGTSSTAAKPGHVYQTAGTYTAQLTVTDARGASSTDSIRIDVGNTSPTPVIQSPADGSLFRVGQQITLRGTATDPQDGPLTAFSMEWTVLLHHASHTHPFLGPTPGNDITFQAPGPENLQAAETSWLEVQLTAIDSKGLRRTVSRALQPRKVQLIFGTQPAGLALDIDGRRVTGPVGVTSWEGYQFRAEVPAGMQAANGKLWSFGSWADGVTTARRTITTGSTPTGYTARFNEAQCGGGIGVGMLIVLAVGAAVRRFRR
jgi:glucose/arabinose dehydrogenase/PKD repeat protein